jgi:hypothetical protein
MLRDGNPGILRGNQPVFYPSDLMDQSFGTVNITLRGQGFKDSTQIVAREIDGGTGVATNLSFILTELAHGVQEIAITMTVVMADAGLYGFLATNDGTYVATNPVGLTVTPF